MKFYKTNIQNQRIRKFVSYLNFNIPAGTMKLDRSGVEMARTEQWPRGLAQWDARGAKLESY